MKIMTVYLIFTLFQMLNKEHNIHFIIHSFTQYITITHFHYPYFTFKSIFGSVVFSFHVSS